MMFLIMLFGMLVESEVVLLNSNLCCNKSDGSYFCTPATNNDKSFTKKATVLEKRLVFPPVGLFSCFYLLMCFDYNWVFLLMYFARAVLYQSYIV